MQSAAPTPRNPTQPCVDDLGTTETIAKVLPGPWPTKALTVDVGEREITVRWTGESVGYGMRMTGGVITDPAEIAAIRKRVEAHAAGRGAWRRVLRRIRSGR